VVADTGAAALGPDKLVPSGRYSTDFAVDVAIAKFADHMPLERQVRQMARDGLDVDSSYVLGVARLDPDPISGKRLHAEQPLRTL
jgi:hypothetical protein